MKPGKWQFSEKFESDLIALIEGRNPTPPAELESPKVYKPIEASDAQWRYLRSLGYTGKRSGLSMGEASQLISNMKESPK